MNQFIKQVFASVIGSMAGLFLFFSLGASSLVLLLLSTSLRSEKPTVKEKSVLVMDLSIPITDNKSPESLGDVLADGRKATISLREVIESIERAANDKQISAILLDARGSTSFGYGTLADVRKALLEFRESGKKVFAYDLDWQEQDFYLATVADQIFVHPLGAVSLNGFSSGGLFFRGALEKYGIGVQEIRVGKYKSAVEPFIRKSFSSETKEQNLELLGDIWDNFLVTVGEDRGLEKEKLLTQINNKGISHADEAQKFGLVDEVAYLDEVVTKLKEINGSDVDKSLPQINLVNYAASNVNKNSCKAKVAIVYAEGTIVSGEGDIGEVGGDYFARILRQLRQDEEIKGVLLRINSPGGSATASEEIWRQLELIRLEGKPTIVSMGNVAASGGYWIATASDRIFAVENTITGSIGVFGLLFNFGEIANNNGITWDVVKTNRFADLNNNFRPKTQEELGIFQDSVDSIYDLFLERVAEKLKRSNEDYQNLPIEEIKVKVGKIAQGRVWSGIDAFDQDLVDEIGGLEAAIQYTVDKAGVKEDCLVEYPRKRSFEAEVIARFLETQVDGRNDNVLTAELMRLKADLRRIESFNDPRDIYSILPLRFDFD